MVWRGRDITRHVVAQRSLSCGRASSRWIGLRTRYLFKSSRSFRRSFNARLQSVDIRFCSFTLPFINVFHETRPVSMDKAQIQLLSFCFTLLKKLLTDTEDIHFNLEYIDLLLTNIWLFHSRKKSFIHLYDQIYTIIHQSFRTVYKWCVYEIFIYCYSRNSNIFPGKICNT